MTTLADLRNKLFALRAHATALDSELLDTFLRQISDWRETDETPATLDDSLERTLGHICFSSRHLHDEVVRCLHELRATVRHLPGMTMNERLAMFDLFDRWDRAAEDERATLYKKLGARP